jgi:hypothetical protein
VLRIPGSVHRSGFRQRATQALQGGQKLRGLEHRLACSANRAAYAARCRLAVDQRDRRLSAGQQRIHPVRRLQGAEYRVATRLARNAGVSCSTRASVPIKTRVQNKGQVEDVVAVFRSGRPALQTSTSVLSWLSSFPKVMAAVLFSRDAASTL